MFVFCAIIFNSKSAHFTILNLTITEKHGIINLTKSLNYKKLNRRNVNMKKRIKASTVRRIRLKNGETRCAICGTPCQGFKAPDGKIICSDCYYKYWGTRP